jgi:hypothetical protein
MVIAGQDPDSNLIVLDSYYESNRLISDHAKGMHNLMDEWAVRCNKQHIIRAAPKQPGIHPACYAFEYILIDPSTQAKTNQSRIDLTSNQDEYYRNGIPTIPAWNALETGLNLVQEYIHVKPSHVHPFHRNPTTGGPVLGSPSMFFVSSDNRNFNGLRELIRFKKTVDEHGRIKYIGRDHWLDNVRYIAMSRPEPPVRTPTDLAILDTSQQLMIRSHEKWAAGFGQVADTNTWFGKAKRPN